MSCVSDFAWASLWAYQPPPFWNTIIKQMFYEEKHLTPSHLNSNPYVVYEGVERTTHKQPNWPMGTMCVSVCVPWGPLCVCWVRGGRGFNKGTGLVQGCQSDCLGTMQPDGVQMRATRLDLFLQTNSQSVHGLHCLLPPAFNWVYSGIWGVSCPIKGTFSLNGTLKLFIDHRMMCYLMFNGAHLIPEASLFFC